MISDTRISRAPNWSLTRWLVDPGGDLPMNIRKALIDALYATIPIFIGGVVNTIAVSGLLATRIPTTPFIIWAVIELVLAAVRLPVLVIGRRAIRENRRGPTDVYIALAVLWAASVGYGGFISVASGDWVAATLACLSAAAMVGGICFRNFAAPRLVAVMITLTLGPVMVAAIMSGEPVLLITAFQIPFYLFSMTVAAYRLNHMLVKTMKAEAAKDHQARHDPLTQVLNRAGLSRLVSERIAAGEEQLSLFFLDLDGFKQINDTLGHSSGDLLLQEVARRLAKVACDDNAVARLGGDEFVVIARESRPDRIKQQGERIIEALRSDGYEIDEQLVFATASVGAATFPLDGANLPDLLEAADRALYHAKSTGGSHCQLASIAPKRAHRHKARFKLVVDQAASA